MAFVTKLLEPVGRVLFFDAASIQRTRGSVAKVKVEIDITKPRPPHLWLGFPQEEGDVYGDGRWQELQFENIPEYCHNCKHQGHHEFQCRIKSREEEYQKRKEEQEGKENDTTQEPTIHKPVQIYDGNQLEGSRQQNLSQPQQYKHSFTEKAQNTNHPPNQTTNSPGEGDAVWQTQKKKGFRGPPKKPNTQLKYQPKQDDNVTAMTVTLPRITNTVLPSITIDNQRPTHKLNQTNDLDAPAIFGGELYCVRDITGNETSNDTASQNETKNVHHAADSVVSPVADLNFLTDKTKAAAESTKAWINRSFGKSCQDGSNSNMMSGYNNLLSITRNHKPDNIIVEKGDTAAIDPGISFGIEKKSAQSYCPNLFDVVAEWEQVQQITNSDMNVPTAPLVDVLVSEVPHPDATALHSARKSGQDCGALPTANDAMTSSAGKDQMIGNAPELQHTSSSAALVQQPARKNRKGRKHANDPTTITSNIQYATGIDLCEENKMAHTVPSQSPNREQSEEERSVNNHNTYREIEQQEQQFACSSRYLSPAHSGVLTSAQVEEYRSKTIPENSLLIPTSQLEVICNEASKMIRDPGKLFSNATKEPESHRKPWHSSQSSFIGQKVPNYKTITLEQLELMSVNDIRRMQEQDQASPPKDNACQKVPNYKTITLEEIDLMSVHDIRRMQEQDQASLSKDRASQQPKRVQPARSSKSNSTRGK